MRARFPYKKKKKRVGRGVGSGRGKTSARGQKGQGSRAGSKFTPGFEGGQMRFILRVPKRGFNSPFKKRFGIVNLDTLNGIGEREITPEKLVELGVVKDLGDGLKVLGRGELKKPLTVHAHRFSGSARTKIEKAGGKTHLIEKLRRPVAEGPGALQAGEES